VILSFGLRGSVGPDPLSSEKMWCSDIWPEFINLLLAEWFIEDSYAQEPRWWSFEAGSQGTACGWLMTLDVKAIARRIYYLSVCSKSKEGKMRLRGRDKQKTHLLPSLSTSARQPEIQLSLRADDVFWYVVQVQRISLIQSFFGLNIEFMSLFIVLSGRSNQVKKTPSISNSSRTHLQAILMTFALERNFLPLLSSSSPWLPFVFWKLKL